MAFSCDALRNLDWKQSRRWIALGIGIFTLFITIVIVRTTTPPLYGSEDGRVAIVGSDVGEGSQFGGEGYQVAALNYHNARRREHQVGPLVLDKKLNDLAVQCAKYYAVEIKTIDHSCPHKARAGENLFRSGGGSTDLTVQSEKACQVWYDEVGQYAFANPGFAMNTGHFTAMVWKASTKLGIGAYSEGSSTVVVALYDPHPNVRGYFPQNVLPKQ